MWNQVQQLPLDLIGSYVISYLNLRDLAMLERAAARKESKQFLVEVLPYWFGLLKENAK